MVENLGLVRAERFSLVGEKSFTAIGANGNWWRRRFSEMRQPAVALAGSVIFVAI
jgi:hypothetical protein